MTVGEALEALTTDSIMPRQLTARELELIEQSKADFRDGRTLTHDQAMARTDAFLAARRASRARS